jgi:hypothetical protein
MASGKWASEEGGDDDDDDDDDGGGGGGGDVQRDEIEVYLRILTF